MNVRRVDDVAGFEALRPEWDRLLGIAPVASVFMSWEWLFTWWKYYGARHRLAILVAEHDGRVAGILPAYVRNDRVFGVFPIRVLRFLGTGGDTAPDDLDALLDPELAIEGAAALAEHVVGGLHAWDLMRLTDMAPSSVFLAALERAMPGRRWAASDRGRSAQISYLNLPNTFDEYLRTFDQAKRGKFRRRRRDVNALPGARFYVCDDPAALDAAIDRLIELHHLRWRGRAEHYAFSSHAYNGFHREVMRLCLAHGWLRLYCLASDEGILAMSYCYRFRDAVFHFQGGFDPARADLQPGGVLMGYVIEHAISEGNRVFDMLRGEYDYKGSWAPERRETHFVEAFRRTPAGLVACLRLEWLPVLRRRLTRPRAQAAAPAANA